MLTSILSEVGIVMYACVYSLDTQWDSLAWIRVGQCSMDKG